MTEEYYVQLFWTIAIPTGIGLLLVVGGVIHYLVTTPEYRRFLRRQKAKRAWANMIGDRENVRDRTAQGPHQGT